VLNSDQNTSVLNKLKVLDSIKLRLEEKLCSMHDWIGIENNLDRTYLNGWIVNRDISNPLDHLLEDFSNEDFLELANKV
jgi:hypothetical protein